MLPTVTWTWREREFIPITVPHPGSPDQKHTVKERGRGGKMIVSLFMFGMDSNEQTKNKNYRCKNTQSASRIKKRARAHTHTTHTTLTWPATNH